MSSKLLNRKRPKQHSTSSVSTNATTPESPRRDTSPSESTTTASTPSDTSAVPQNVSDAFAQVHPSLVEYLSLFPASASLAVVDPSQQPYNPATPANPPLQEQYPQSMDGITNTSTQYTQFFSGVSSQGQPATQNGTTQQAQAMPVQEPLNFLGEPSLSALNLPDMGFTEDVLMSEHWMNLMRETGILDSNGNFAGVQNGDFLPQELMF